MSLDAELPSWIEPGWSHRCAWSPCTTVPVSARGCPRFIWAHCQHASYLTLLAGRSSDPRGLICARHAAWLMSQPNTGVMAEAECRHEFVKDRAIWACHRCAQSWFAVRDQDELAPEPPLEQRVPDAEEIVPPPPPPPPARSTTFEGITDKDRSIHAKVQASDSKAKEQAARKKRRRA
jgi:hypothetical protein